ncbi:MAG: cytidylate kinase family protein [Propionibacteriaceae bacterium]|nr:cytidylate kinase family protein [Propionibacteriaceae bacterium]
MTGQHPLVITLWETYGSNMEAVSEALAAELGLPLHQQAYSSQAIEEATAEREREGALGRLLRNFAPANFAFDGAVSNAATAEQANYAAMAEENTAQVHRAAEAGGVIQGRNGQYILKDRPNTVHVKLDGSVEGRVRFAAQGGLGEERAARRQLIEDEFRSQLSQKTYHFDPRDNGWYDVVVNGSGLPVGAVVAVIKAAVEGKSATS